MNTEKSGGVFLLQETEPKRLLGCLISTTSDTGHGWIHGSFFDTPGSMIFVDVGNKIDLVLSRDVAFSLIGLLHVLVATNAYIRGPDSRWTCGLVESGRITVSLRPEMKKSSLVASWVPDPESITCQVVGDQIEWRVREDLAMELVFVLVRQLAVTAAGTVNK